MFLQGTFAYSTKSVQFLVLRTENTSQKYPSEVKKRGERLSISTSHKGGMYTYVVLGT